MNSNPSMQSIMNTLTEKSTLQAVAISCVILLGISYVFHGTTGMPCYCKACEHKLITDAQAGDPVAQQKLQNAIYDAKTPSTLSYFGQGAFGFMVLLVVLWGFITVVSYFTKTRATSALNPIMQRMV